MRNICCVIISLVMQKQLTEQRCKYFIKRETSATKEGNKNLFTKGI